MVEASLTKNCDQEKFGQLEKAKATGRVFAIVQGIHVSSFHDYVHQLGQNYLWETSLY